MSPLLMPTHPPRVSILHQNCGAVISTRITALFIFNTKWRNLWGTPGWGVISPWLKVVVYEGMITGLVETSQKLKCFTCLSKALAVCHEKGKKPHPTSEITVVDAGLEPSGARERLREEGKLCWKRDNFYHIRIK